jgi:hypothetical protein
MGTWGRPKWDWLWLTESLTLVEKTGERVYEAELYRLKGELLLRQNTGRSEAHATPLAACMSAAAGQGGEAETCFQQALAIARRQQAKSLELRAAMSLARLWQQQDKYAAAHQLLAEVYSWFTEGFDTADLQEARALLDVLGENTGEANSAACRQAP